MEIKYTRIPDSSISQRKNVLISEVDRAGLKDKKVSFGPWYISYFLSEIVEIIKSVKEYLLVNISLKT